MSDTLSIDLRATVGWLRQESLVLSTIADAAQAAYSASLSPGTAAAEADVLWYDQLVLAAGAHQDLDLTNLPSTLFGNSVATSFAGVRALLVVNTATTAGDDLLVGGAGSAAHAWAGPFNDNQDATLVVPADSAVLLVNKLPGWGVVAGTNNVLRIANSGSDSVTLNIVLAGRSV